MPRQPTIAIVNNERGIVISLGMALEAEGFTVRRYLNTQDALQLLDDPADVAFIDKTNPPLGGMELYRRIRAANDMPVIFLSAWAEDIEEDLRGTGREADGYVPTPFSQRHVVTLVRDVLRRHPPKPTIALVSARNRTSSA